MRVYSILLVLASWFPSYADEPSRAETADFLDALSALRVRNVSQFLVTDRTTVDELRTLTNLMERFPDSESFKIYIQHFGISEIVYDMALDGEDGTEIAFLEETSYVPRINVRRVYRHREDVRAAAISLLGHLPPEDFTPSQWYALGEKYFDDETAGYRLRLASLLRDRLGFEAREFLFDGFLALRNRTARVEDTFSNYRFNPWPGSTTEEGNPFSDYRWDYTTRDPSDSRVVPSLLDAYVRVVQNEELIRAKFLSFLLDPPFTSGYRPAKVYENFIFLALLSRGTESDVSAVLSYVKRLRLLLNNVQVLDALSAALAKYPKMEKQELEALLVEGWPEGREMNPYFGKFYQVELGARLLERKVATPETLQALRLALNENKDARRRAPYSRHYPEMNARARALLETLIDRQQRDIWARIPKFF